MGIARVIAGGHGSAARVRYTVEYEYECSEFFFPPLLFEIIRMPETRKANTARVRFARCTRIRFHRVDLQVCENA